MKTILFLIGTAILTHFIPFSAFFRNVDTLIHESGHALMTLVLSGDVQYIHLFADHSGVTLSTVRGAWRFIPISLAGYIISALFTVLLFYLYKINRQKLGLVILTILTLLVLVLFVRNEFGVIWCAGFIILNVAAYMISWTWLRNLYFALIAFISLVESVVGPVYLLTQSIMQPARAGDATNLSEATMLPAFVWSLLFTIIALWCASRSIRFFLQQPTNQSQNSTKS
ncbi:M50 family metallopeptidase [Paenibacillus sp. N1-5-1-14]|uniref:M50 family metallopeptidase n=1 Tax=Paenibacillus radicibacter TaxID=2972488 RepID=UPI0021597296|nr:M50 family metallopeptidase [Paenibacillus radicibacter]MCR8643480.1 M50 family metallopeptidase [Paenibacillus radicibacter]